MATSRLGLYNIALRAIGERALTSLDEEGEPRRCLDEVYSAGNGVIRYGLEQGLWNFAIDTRRLDASSDVGPAFRFTYAFTKPTDLVRLVQISADEMFSIPLNRYEIEGDYIYADTDPLYIRMVSDDEVWGADFGRWPDTFTLWLGHWMATQIAPRLKNDIDMERLERRTHRYLVDARSKDAMQEPTRFPPLGNWARSRMGRSGYRDRGPRNTLYS